jgi:hypothetical protein
VTNIKIESLSIIKSELEKLERKEKEQAFDLDSLKEIENRSTTPLASMKSKCKSLDRSIFCNEEKKFYFESRVLYMSDLFLQKAFK